MTYENIVGARLTKRARRSSHRPTDPMKWEGKWQWTRFDTLGFTVTWREFTDRYSQRRLRRTYIILKDGSIDRCTQVFIQKVAQ